jgi:hypothetical protein
MPPKLRTTPFVIGLSIAVVAVLIFSAGTANARSLRPPELPEDAWEEETEGLSGPASETEWKDGPSGYLEDSPPKQERIGTDESESARVGICLVGVESPCNGDTWEEKTKTDNASSQDETVSAASDSPEFTAEFKSTDQTRGSELNGTEKGSPQTTSAWEESVAEGADSENQTK